MKTKLGILTVCYIIVLTMFLTTHYLYNNRWYVNASPEWFAEGWLHREKISLSSRTPEIDFQVKVLLNTDVINYNLFKANGDDIRFYTSDGRTCNYWIQDWNTSGTSVIWIKVPVENIESLQMYYGEASADSASNGFGTFLFFDDFENGTDKWTVFDPGTEIINPSTGAMETVDYWNGKALWVYRIASGGFLSVRPDWVETESSIVEFEYRTPTTPDRWKAVYLTYRFKMDVGGDRTWQQIYMLISDKRNIAFGYDYAGNPSSPLTWLTDHTYQVKAVRNGMGGGMFYLDGEQLGGTISYTPSYTCTDFVVDCPDDTYGHYFDNFRIRKYSVNDVTGTIETEEDGPSPALAIWGAIITFSAIGVTNVVIFYVIRPRPKPLEKI